MNKIMTFFFYSSFLFLFDKFCDMDDVEYGLLARFGVKQEVAKGL